VLDLDAGVDWPIVRACDCGAAWPVELTSAVTMPPTIERDARGRRLRAALAAVLARDNAPQVWLMHEWLDS
jgi:hypothetical protein